MKHKIKVILAINHDSLNADTEKELAILSHPQFQIDVCNLTRAANFIENRYDAYQAFEELIDVVINAEREGYAGIMIDCFADPAIDLLRELVDIPVVGAFAPTVLMTSLLTQKFSIITILSSLKPELNDLARRVGIEANIASIRTLEIKGLDLDEQNILVEKLTQESLQAIHEDGAEAIILGCTGMLGITEKLQAKLHCLGLKVPVVNPATGAVAMLQALISQGLTHSRLTYPKACIQNKLIKATEKTCDK